MGHAELYIDTGKLPALLDDSVTEDLIRRLVCICTLSYARQSELTLGRVTRPL